MRRLILTSALLALAVCLIRPVSAQQVVPTDISNPASDAGVPDLLDTVILPDVQFIFDGLLDPDRVSLIEQITNANLDDARLTAAAQSLIRNHLVAMQQVELAIQFLQTNRDSILAGGNSEFNSVFGNPGELREVAVVNPTPLSGTATVQTSIDGLIELEFEDDDMPNLPGQLNVGDFVFVGDAINNDPDGFVMEVEQVLFDADGSNQSALGTSTFGGALVTASTGDIPVHKIISFEQQTDPARFERVVQTFAAIRDALQGTDPSLSLTPDLQVQNTISYQRSFEDINNIWAPGVAQFSSLDEVVRRELDRTGLTSTRTADRLVRQAGFSNSDSHFHIDRLDDQGFGQTVDYLPNGGPGHGETFPLLWTEDNELPLNFSTNTPVAGSTDEDRAFFRDRQTIFGEPDNPFTQYIGRAFLEETIFHQSDFFDDSIVVTEDTITQTFQQPIFDNTGRLVGFQDVTVSSPLELTQTDRRRPVRGDLTSQNGNDLDVRQVPESGTPVTAQTERRKWQMIIESFAEHSTDLEALNVAAIGVAAMFGDFVPPDLLARDAGSYADFAALIGNSASLNGINVLKSEPFGKRATAGFNPIVPRN